MARARGPAPLPGLDAPPDAARSRVMRAVRGKDTRPELRVRRLLHRLGYRYRLHVAGLPGKPDLVFPARASVIFVHGCFWHGHDCPRGARPPRANAAYWTAKIARNVERDARNRAELEASGWQVHVVWECEMKDAEALAVGSRGVSRTLRRRHQRIRSARRNCSTEVNWVEAASVSTPSPEASFCISRA